MQVRDTFSLGYFAREKVTIRECVTRVREGLRFELGAVTSVIVWGSGDNAVVRLRALGDPGVESRHCCASLRR
jgi:hypothetical protein